VMYENLKNKIVLVTGASSGIGEAISRIFAKCGSNLIITARRIERLNKLKEELEALGVKVFVSELDVRSRDSVDKMAKSIPEEFSKIDILINNAGLALGIKHTYENDLDQMEQMIDTNVKGVFYMIRAIVPVMILRNSGHIINISSVAGLEGYPGGSGYCASKYAVQGLTMAVRKELVATQIRVSSICPGLCQTEFSIVRFSGNKEAADKVYEGIQVLTGEDVADNVAYIASRPPHVQITDMTIYPTNQASPQMVHRVQPTGK